MRLGRRTYGNEVVEKTDPRGRKYYWIGGEGGATNEDIPGSDCNAALKDGLVAVTPLHLDSTHDAVLLRAPELDRPRVREGAGAVRRRAAALARSRSPPALALVAPPAAAAARGRRRPGRRPPLLAPGDARAAGPARRRRAARRARARGRSCTS